MQREDLVPGSDEWKANRNKKGTINASSAASFVGINAKDRQFSHIKDPVERGIWQIKQNFEYLKDYSLNTFDGNWWTRAGNYYEPYTITLTEKMMGFTTTKSNSWQDEEEKFVFSTPDYLVDAQSVDREIDFGKSKIQTKQVFKDACGEVKNPASVLPTTVPVEHMCQMQIQLHTTKREENFYTSSVMKLKKARIWSVPFSQEYWDWLIPQLRYLHEVALEDLPTEQLDFEMFDFKPPFVAFTLLKEVKNISDVIGPVPVFPEPYPYKKWTGKRKVDNVEEINVLDNAD